LCFDIAIKNYAEAPANAYYITKITFEDLWK